LFPLCFPIAVANYTHTLMDHVLAPRSPGVMQDPDLTRLAGTLGRGAFLILFLKLDQDRIVAAKYHRHACGPMIVYGSTPTKPLFRRSIGERRMTSTSGPIVALGGGANWCGFGPESVSILILGGKTGTLPRRFWPRQT
jgi:hypothetical protein